MSMLEQIDVRDQYNQEAFMRLAQMNGLEILLHLLWVKRPWHLCVRMLILLYPRARIEPRKRKLSLRRSTRRLKMMIRVIVIHQAAAAAHRVRAVTLLPAVIAAIAIGASPKRRVKRRAY